jgi:hypothetical protein
MQSILEKLTQWLRELLIAAITDNLTGLFDSVNSEVGEIADRVGQTPQGWNSSIYTMVQSLAENIMVPIAGMILALVMCYELIQMIVEKNNLHDVDTFLFFKWVFKSFAAVLLVSNTFNIIMGVFEATQSVVQQASGLISGSTAVGEDLLASLETTLEDMELGPLLGLWVQSSVIGLAIHVLAALIFVITYGRMLEVYLLASVGPIPLATMANKEYDIGSNYLKSLLAIGFQAFLIMVCVAIYAILVQTIALTDDPIAAIWSCLGYTVLLCFALQKTGSLAKSVFGAR